MERFGCSTEQVFGVSGGADPNLGVFAKRIVEMDVTGPNGITTIQVEARISFLTEDIRRAYKRAVQAKRPRHAIQRIMENR